MGFSLNRKQQVTVLKGWTRCECGDFVRNESLDFHREVTHVLVAREKEQQS